VAGRDGPAGPGRVADRAGCPRPSRRAGRAHCGGPRRRTADAAGGGAALHRTGGGFPPDAAQALVEAVEAGATIDPTWERDALGEIIADTRDDAFAGAFLTGVLRPDSPSYQKGVYALMGRCEASRSAPARYVPLLRPLLACADQEAREDASRAVYHAGRAAALVADVLVATIETLPRVTGTHRVSPEERALATLVRLNDPRWIPVVCRRACNSIENLRDDGAVGRDDHRRWVGRCLGSK
jgi:hypothetical protein